MGNGKGVVGSFFGSSMTTCRQRIESMLCRELCAVRKSRYIVELFIHIYIYIYVYILYIYCGSTFSCSPCTYALYMGMFVDRERERESDKASVSTMRRSKFFQVATAAERGRGVVWELPKNAKMGVNLARGNNNSQFGNTFMYVGAGKQGKG